MVGRKRFPCLFSKKCFAAIESTGCSDSTSSLMVSVNGDKSLLASLKGSTSSSLFLVIPGVFLFSVVVFFYGLSRFSGVIARGTLRGWEGGGDKRGGWEGETLN